MALILVHGMEVSGLLNIQKWSSNILVAFRQSLNCHTSLLGSLSWLCFPLLMWVVHLFKLTQMKDETMPCIVLPTYHKSKPPC